MNTPDTETLYNARAAVPTCMDNIQQWQERSIAVRENHNCTLDIAYGPSLRQKLDLFPADADNAPLMVFIHGGYWQALDKSFSSFVAEGLNPHGISAAVVGYDLCPDVTLDDITGQIRNAVAYLHHHARELGFDPERVFVGGHSAGGHLAAACLATDWQALDPTRLDHSAPPASLDHSAPPASHDISAPPASLDHSAPPTRHDISAPPANPVAGGVSISGVFDLAPLLDTTMNEKIGLDSESARRNSPMFALPTARVPLILAVGGDESTGFHDQSDRLAQRWEDGLQSVERINLAGCHHFSAVEQLGDADSTLIRAIAAMVGGAG